MADDYLGKPIGIIESYRKIGSAWLSLVLAVLLVGLGYFGLLIVFIIPCIGWALAIPGVGMMVFFNTVVVPLIAPVIILERLSVTHSLGRAWNLARRRFWWSFGFMLLLTILAQAIILGPAVLFTALFVTSFEAGGASSTMLAVVQQLITTLLNVLYLPLQFTCITLLYFDIRIRTEGFDLALASVIEEQKDITDMSQDLPPSETRLVFDGTETGYFVAITLGVAVIVGAIFLFFGSLLAFLGTTL